MFFGSSSMIVGKDNMARCVNPLAYINYATIMSYYDIYQHVHKTKFKQFPVRFRLSTQHINLHQGDNPNNLAAKIHAV